MDDHGSGMREGADPWFGPEHRMLRDQVRRFVEEEIKPRADAWEEQGFVPRDVLRRMGELGFFGIRYPAAYGGSEMDALGTVVLAEELGRSTYGGFAITVLVHTDMASVHVFNGGTEEQRARWMPGIIAGEVITAVAVTEPDAGSDVKGIRTTARRRAGRLRPQRHEALHHQRRPRRSVLRRREDRRRARPEPRPDDVPRREGHARASASAARSTSTAGARRTPRSSHFDDCRIPAENVLGEEGRGFYAIMRNFQNERLAIAAMAIGEAQAAIELTLA